MHYLLALLLALSLFSAPSQADTVKACDNSTDCAEIGHWDIRLAFGYGKKSNPLRDFDDISLYVAPSFAYYGDNWFFDNGNIGYTLTEGENYTINLTTSYSIDRAYFYRWDPANIFLLSSKNMGRSTVSGVTMPGKNAESEPIFHELESRKFTYLGGAEAFIYTRVGIINVSIGHDLFNVHQGTEAKLKWLYNIPLDRWNLEFAAVLHWKSEEVVDYYYGIRPSENPYWSEKYQAESALNKGLEFTGQYVLTADWNLLFVARYTQIADEIAASPLLNKDYSSTYFVGAAYRF